MELETVKLTKEGLKKLQDYLIDMKTMHSGMYKGKKALYLYMAMQFHHLNGVDKEGNFTASKNVIQCIFGNNLPLYIENINEEEFLSNDSEEVQLAI